MADITAFAAAAANKDGLLKLIYQDLAQPGVQQVGRALQMVMTLGNNILLPLRLLNETARRYEERKFDEIAERFKAIPLEETIEISPEIGVPIMERLSYADDNTIRGLFIELLAKASSIKMVEMAHPSFVNVISSLSPDEAIVLQSLSGRTNVPLISIDAKNDSGSITLHDFIIVPPEELSHPDRMPLYISNLSGLGLLEIRRDTFLTKEGAYDAVIAHAQNALSYPNTFPSPDGDRPVEPTKHMLTVLPYGKSFISACTMS